MSYLELAKRAERKLRTSYIEASQPPEAPESERPDPESLAAKVLAELEPDEAGRIVDAWREILGIELNRDRVKDEKREAKFPDPALPATSPTSGAEHA
jgi:hypothetical protein